MFPFWLLDINNYIAFVTGFAGNGLVIFLLMVVKAKEIRTYRWFIIFQAIIEAFACSFFTFLKIASFFFEIYKN